MIKKKIEVGIAKDNMFVSATSNKMVADAAAKMVGTTQDQMDARKLAMVGVTGGKLTMVGIGPALRLTGLKAIKLTSLTDKLNVAIKEKNPVNIDVNSKEPEEILKGTYIADTLSKQGYSCNARILAGKDILNWTCEPSE